MPHDHSPVALVQKSLTSDANQGAQVKNKYSGKANEDATESIDLLWDVLWRDFQVSRYEIRSPSRIQRFVCARQALAYFLRVHPDYCWSLYKIADILTREYTTVFYSINEVRNLITMSDNIKKVREVTRIVQALWEAQTLHRLSELGRT